MGLKLLSIFWIWKIHRLLLIGAFITAYSDLSGEDQKFRVTPNDVTIKEGENVILPCEIDHLSGRVQWTKDGFALGYKPIIQGYPRYYMLIEPNGVFNLRIKNISLEDDAEFQCQVGPTLTPTVQHAIRAAARINVTTAPTEISIVGYGNNSKVRVKEQQDVKLECIVGKSKPPSQIVWYKGRTELKIESREDKILDCKSLNGSKTVVQCDTVSEIIFKATASDDNSEYFCVAKHEALPLSKSLFTSIQLNILYQPGPPYIEGYNEGDVLHAGEEIKLTCKSKGGSPLAQLVWYKNGDSVQPIYRTIGNTSENTYSFQVEPSDNAAEYFCLATSAALTQPLKLSIKLNVYFGPTEVSINGDTEGKSEKIAVVSCTTTSSYPAAIIKWFVDGQLITNSSHFETKASYRGSVTTSRLSFTVPSNKREVLVLCYGMNQQLSKSAVANHTIRILYPPGQPIINGYVKGGYVAAGTVHRIVCISSGGNPLATLTWFKNDKKIPSSMRSSDENSISSEMSILANGTDNGSVYKCEATNPATVLPLIATIRLNVYFPPSSVMVNIEPKELRAGTNARLYCNSTSSNPEAEISWSRDGIQITDGISTFSKPGLHGGKLSFSELLINITSDMHGNSFSCQAKNSVLQIGVNFAIELSILYKPVFMELNETVFVLTEGENLRVPLKINANPGKMTFKWMRNKSQIYRGIDGSTLNIAKISRTDVGFYTCEARNSEGSDSISFSVSVKYGAGITNISEFVMCSEKSDAIMYCSVDGNPIQDSHVKWKKSSESDDDYDVINRSEVHYSAENKTSSFILHNVTKYDMGYYYCVVNNGIASQINKSAFLAIEHEPVIDLESHILKAASKISETTKFTCIGSGAPKLSFTWVKDNSILNGSMKYSINFKQMDKLQYASVLTIKDVQSTDYGNYSCILRNKLGFSSVPFLLTVTSKPDPPKNLKVISITDNSVTLNWNLDFDGGEQTVFQVRYHSINADTENYKYEDVGTNTTYEVRGLESGCIYVFDVVASNKLGSSGYSSHTVNATIPGELRFYGIIDTDGIILAIAVLIVIVLILVNFCLVLIFLLRRSKNQDKVLSAGQLKSHAAGLDLATVGLNSRQLSLVCHTGVIIDKISEHSSDKSGTIEMYGSLTDNSTILRGAFRTNSDKADDNNFNNMDDEPIGLSNGYLIEEIDYPSFEPDHHQFIPAQSIYIEPPTPYCFDNQNYNNNYSYSNHDRDSKSIGYASLGRTFGSRRSDSSILLSHSHSNTPIPIITQPPINGNAIYITDPEYNNNSSSNGEESPILPPPMSTFSNNYTTNNIDHIEDRYIVV